MMPGWVLVFWASLGFIVYPYLVYPLALALLRQFGRPWKRGSQPTQSVSIVIAARNEEGRIAGRVAEFLNHLTRGGIPGEVLVVSDGSSDTTVTRVRALEDSRVRLVELVKHSGKAVAVNQGCAQAAGAILVLADVRQTWERHALANLLENFADPRVGAVSGDLVLERCGGALGGIGLYWQLEKWIRRQESRLHSCVGVTGAICAVRRELFRPIPAGTILDDVYWPLRVVLAGYRVVHDERALCFDRLPQCPRHEFRRKVRTLAGNFQLLFRLPSALRPWRNPALVPFVSHKLLRLPVPWALLTLLVSSGAIPAAPYRAFFVAQCICYACALLALSSRAFARIPLMSAAAGFLVLNGACGLAWLVWLSGGTGRVWRSARYDFGDGSNA